MALGTKLRSSGAITEAVPQEVAGRAIAHALLRGAWSLPFFQTLCRSQPAKSRSPEHLSCALFCFSFSHSCLEKYYASGGRVLDLQAWKTPKPYSALHSSFCRWSCFSCHKLLMAHSPVMDFSARLEHDLVRHQDGFVVYGMCGYWQVKATFPHGGVNVFREQDMNAEYSYTLQLYKRNYHLLGLLVNFDRHGSHAASWLRQRSCPRRLAKQAHGRCDGSAAT